MTQPQTLAQFLARRAEIRSDACEHSQHDRCRAEGSECPCHDEGPGEDDWDSERPEDRCPPRE